MEAGNISNAFLHPIPSSLFPPGSRWTSTREMLHELMGDLHREWVQNYLFEPDSAADARILSSPSHLSNSFSFTFLERIQLHFPGQQDVSFDDLCCSSIVVPAFRKDGISAAVSVENQSDNYIQFVMCPRKYRFLRCVRNDRTGIICTVSFDDERGVVEMAFYYMGSLFNSWHAMFTFEANKFKRAFTPGLVDFDILESAIMYMGVGHSFNVYNTPTSQQPTGTQFDGTPVSLSRVPDCKLATWAFIAFGESQHVCTFSAFDKGVPVIFHPMFADTSRNAGVASSVIDKMVRWGIRDRLRRLQPVVPAVMPCLSEDLDDDESVEEVDSSGIEAFVDDVDKILSGNSCNVLELSEFIDPEKNFSYAKNSNAHRSEVSSSMSPDSPTTAVQDIQILPAKELFLCKDSNQQPLRIAPAPTAVTNGTDMPTASASFVATLENERLAKLEQRKIRKREAALRSNAKRSERRRQARLAREKGVTASQSVP